MRRSGKEKAGLSFEDKFDAKKNEIENTRKLIRKLEEELNELEKKQSLLDKRKK